MFRLALQSCITALQQLVLTRIIQQVKINVAVIVGLLLHPHSRISAAQLLAQTQNPFGNGLDAFVCNPFQLNRAVIVRDISTQAVERIGAMVIFLVMQIDVMQGGIQVGQRLFGTIHIIIIGGNRAVSARYLIPVAVSLEQSQRPTRVRKRKAVEGQAFIVDETQHARTAPRKNLAVLPEIQQFGKRLQGIRLEINISLCPAHHQAIGQVIQFARKQLLACRRFVHASRATHIHIIQPLRRIAPDSVHINGINRLQRGVLLLKVIKINPRNDVKLRDSVVQAKPGVRVGYLAFVLTDTAHPPQGVVPIIIKLLVHGRALAYLHPPHIRYQAFYLIIPGFRSLKVKTFRTLEVHAHKGTESLVVQGFGTKVGITFRQPERLLSGLYRPVQVAVTQIIGKAVQRIGLTPRLHPSDLPAASRTEPYEPHSQPSYIPYNPHKDTRSLPMKKRLYHRTPKRPDGTTSSYHVKESLFFRFL